MATKIPKLTRKRVPTKIKGSRTKGTSKPVRFDSRRGLPHGKIKFDPKDERGTQMRSSEGVLHERDFAGLSRLADVHKATGTAKESVKRLRRLDYGYPTKKGKNVKTRRHTPRTR